MKYYIAAFYKFEPINDVENLVADLRSQMLANDVRGTILVTPEGVNGTICGSETAVTGALDIIRQVEGFSDLEHKVSYAESHVFKRTKVKVKRETISIGKPVDARNYTGKYLSATEWNDMIRNNPDVVIVDARNDYEYEVGAFEGAVNPKTTDFKDIRKFTESELPSPEENKVIATYCTGGIRCEKYTSYLLELGYKDVYHLKGGILKYFEEISPEESLFHGDCFVFDERFAVNHDLQPLKTLHKNN